jgi:hypothetical protein
MDINTFGRKVARLAAEAGLAIAMSGCRHGARESTAGYVQNHCVERCLAGNLQ